MAPMNEEREMTRYQCGLVDTCFEEGQYASGMAVLDQLRSPSFKPHIDHIRQLLYIALFPPPPAAGHQTIQRERSPLVSPTKQKPPLSKASPSPSVADSQTAQRILFSFLATNSPGSLSRALPRYPSDDDDLPPGSSHDGDSLIAQESLCIKNCRNCWAILKEGFIQRKTRLPRDTGKKRTRSSYDVDVPDLDQGHDAPAVIAEHAWPVLDWLLSLFEKDELFSSQSSGGKFSLLLLSQIPPPRGGSGPRWEASTPLDIIFHAIEQEDGQRRAMAARLLTLFINLTLSGSFDGPMFAAALTTRLNTCAPQTVQSLMESLPKNVPVLTFKVTVCQKFLSSSPSVTGGSKPRPRPLPRRGPRREPGTESSATDDVSRAESSVAPLPVLATCSDIFQLLRSDHQSQKLASTPPILTIKERDSDWQDTLSNGGLKDVVDVAFPNDSMYHTALTILISVWPPSD